MCGPVLVWPYPRLALCPSGSVPVLQLVFVLGVFGGSFFDDAFLHDPVSILHPFTIFKWLLYTLVCAVFPFRAKRLLE
jgi:hypothetical protein